MSAPAQDKQEECKFLKLPAELRNHVYEYALTSVAAIHSECPMPLSSLLATCRQVRAEANPIYYANNTFEIDHAAGRCIHWFESRPEEARAYIGTVRLHCLRGSVNYNHAVSDRVYQQRLLAKMRNEIARQGLGPGGSLEVLIDDNRSVEWTSKPRSMHVWECGKLVTGENRRLGSASSAFRVD